MRRNRIFFMSLLSFCISGCASIPKWVQGPLSYEKGVYIYVVGYSPPTFFQHDAEKYAQDNALYELAKILKVEIKQTVIDIMTSQGKKVSSDDSLLSISEQTVNEALSQCEPISVWYDKDGKIKEKGSAFSLMRMKREILNDKLKEKIK